MHPEIARDAPGSCPIRGMALEPTVPDAVEPAHGELGDMTRRFWIGLALALPVVGLEMGGHLTGMHGRISQHMSNQLQFLLATPVVPWAGWPFFTRAWSSLTGGRLNMFTLIALGTGAAWLHGVVATGAPGVFPAAFRDGDGSVAAAAMALSSVSVIVDALRLRRASP
jgi:Cu+-exporting ATPase